MSKINSGLYLLLGILIASIGFSVYLGPVLADSTTATVIGGATNGNIFGSIQFDEMNVTDTGVWRFDTGGGPILATATYNAVNPTLIYNSSVIMTLPLTLFGAAADFQGNAVTNVGNAGNDFGATNTLVATMFSGTVNVANQSLIHLDQVTLTGGGDGIATFSLINTGSMRFYTWNNVAAETQRLSITSNVAIATATVAATTWDFAGNLVNNVGSAGNDFGASNTLVATTFSGIVDGGGFGFNNLGAAGNDFGATNTLVETSFSGNVSINAFQLIFSGNSFPGGVPTTLTLIGVSGDNMFFNVPTGKQYNFNINGAASNILGAANTLVGTTFSGIVDGGGFGFNNLGAAGNDFGATFNTLIATNMSGAIDLNNQNLVDVANIASDTDNAITLQGNHDNGGAITINAARLAASAGQCITIATNDNVDAMTTRFLVNCGTATVSGVWSAITHSGFTLGAVMKVSGNNTIPIFEDAVRPSNLYTVIITSKSQTTGDINFEGGDLDWTLIETGILGDNYKGLVLIDKPTIIDGVYVFPETYRRVFEVNEDGIFHLGNKLAEDRRVSDLENRIQDLENILELRN